MSAISSSPRSTSAMNVNGNVTAVGDLRVEVHEHIATVTLDRPPVNAVNTETFAETQHTFTSFNDDRDARVAVFTGAGDRAFMAGVDLKSVGPRDKSEHVPAALITDPARLA